MRFVVRLAGIVWLVVSCLGCPGGARPALLPIPRTTGRVSETVRIPIAVENPEGAALRYAFEVATSLPALATVTTISGSPSAGELRWTPLASHVGTHDVTIILRSPSGEEYDRETAIVEISPSSDAAPVFVEPGAGGTYDLARDPCVRVAIEVRDDDSPSVTLRERAALPIGATLTQDASKSGTIVWCPTNDQIAAAERWTLRLEADDGDLPPVPHDYVVVLRSGGGTGCMGSPPSVRLLAPAGGDRVPSGAGTLVQVSASDDRGLREPPILYWTTEPPADPARPDITEFRQALFAPSGVEGEFTARVPSLGLMAGEEREVFFVVSATDNDDDAGTSCDHRVDTALGSFFAVGGGGGALAACAACTASIECASGLCATSSRGALCLDPCTTGCAGQTCSTVTTVAGARAMACTRTADDAASACTSSCTNDGMEPNNTIAAARPLSARATGRICAGDVDVYSLGTSTRGAQIELTLSGFRSGEGDLDLRLLAADGTILARSAGVTDMERITHCATSDAVLYASVFGFDDSQNGYDLSLVVRPAGCCINDSNEPDDSVGTGRLLSGPDFDGTLCASDNDFRTFDVAALSDARITIVPDGDAIVDIELFDATGMSIATSTDVAGTPTIATRLSPGRYAIRVFGYMSAGDAYLGEITLAPASTGCSRTSECPIEQVCEAGRCRGDACTSPSMCPAMHLCPDVGPTTGASDCGAVCAVNADCRAAEACKWFPEGRACGTRGTGALGAACSTFRDCGGQRTCVDWPGGACTRAGCARSTDCEPSSYCVTSLGVSACAVDCATDPTRCRAGYTCRSVTDRSGAMRSVCVP